ncbi:hypothetical protein H8D29_00625 [PVC group bacterium]|nr:hypothetical protein [PVC group bacterium]
MIISVIDEPVNKDEPLDGLGIQQHAFALSEFISSTGTPLTIGIQGEWGSGKTSLLNTIYCKLTDNPMIKQIWINAWENSLLATPEEALIKIIGQIIEEMIGADDSKDRTEKIKSITKTVFSGALRVSAAAAFGTKGGAVADELLEGQTNNIKELRENLIQLISDIRKRKTNPYDHIVIYVDDLDRMIPAEAVRILELMKNIFSVPGCVFVLAIDYQVIVKGLESKFGKQTAKNEWEFRAFFDKIIQLPYMMPMAQYKVGEYVNQLLQEIGYIIDEDYAEHLEHVVKNTIGGNPRSIKRLINSVALISLFSKSQTAVETPKEWNESTSAILLFALVCIQIAYPDIYDLLLTRPDFQKWDSNLLLSIQATNNNEIDENKLEKALEIASNTEDFDEEWEKILFKICYRKDRYRAKVTNISRALSTIKDDLVRKDENIASFIRHAHSLTSVTNVTSTDTVQSSVEFKDASWKSADEKIVTNAIWKHINKQFPKLNVLKISDTLSCFSVRRKIKGFPCLLVMTQGARFLLDIRGGKTKEENLFWFDLLQKESEFIIAEMRKLLVGCDGISLDWSRNPNIQTQTMALSSYMQEIIWNKITDKGVGAEELWDEIAQALSMIAPAFENVMVSVINKVFTSNTYHG